MTMVPVHNPPNGPVKTPLNGMFVGKSIYIFGKIDADATRFEVNLLCGDDVQFSNIALRLNSSFVDRKVVRNSIINTVAGEEENDGAFPFTKGDYFSHKITCKQSHFVIEANDGPFTTYEHRVPYILITHVNVAQQCQALLITSQINGVETPAVTLDKPSLDSYLLPFYNVSGRKIQIAGTRTDTSFAIDLLMKDGRKIFHYNPRGRGKQIVRNTLTGGSWGPEERSLDITFPFKKSGPFQTAIGIIDNKFVVTINDTPAFTYDNRVDGGIEQIRSMEIKNVQLEYVKYF